MVAWGVVAPGVSLSESESEVLDTAVDEGEEDLDDARDARGGVCLGFIVGVGCTRVGVNDAEGGVGGATTGFASSFGVAGPFSVFPAHADFASACAAAVPKAPVPA